MNWGSFIAGWIACTLFMLACELFMAARAKLAGGCRAQGAGDRTLTDNVRTHCADGTTS